MVDAGQTLPSSARTATLLALTLTATAVLTAAKSNILAIINENQDCPNLECGGTKSVLTRIQCRLPAEGVRAKCLYVTASHQTPLPDC